MATSDRQGPTPLAFSDLVGMFASETGRIRGRNESTATLASRCLGNKKRQPHHLTGRSRGPRGPRPTARNPARRSKARWHVGKDESPRYGRYERAVEIARQVNPVSRLAEEKPKEATSDSWWQRRLPRRTRPVEQGLEVGPTGPPDGERQEGRSPRKRDGCRRGKSFEGLKRRRGRHALPEPKGTGQAARNSANPRIGSGVQQTRKTARGANHQDGEKP